MPIHCPISIEPISDAEFERIDAAVMRCAYASQNELGRLCDERVYENDLAARLRAEGFAVLTQVPVTVNHLTFTKTYRLDLVVNHMLYELKTAAAIIGEHESQALHYAVMLALSRVKIINFGSPKVGGLLKRSPVTRADARRIASDVRRWKPIGPACERLRRCLTAFLEDVGGFLQCHLYEEAMIHACGGEAGCVVRLPVMRDTLALGTHRFSSHDHDLAFIVTCFTSGAAAHESHVKRLLGLTSLRAIQWFNIAHNHLDCVTLERVGKAMGAGE